MHPLFSLKNQVALITGVGSAEGIGFATATLLAEMGATVAITATGQRIHARSKELQANGHTVRAYVADLTDRSATKAMIAAIDADLGRIDILINNAGMSKEGSDELESTFATISDDEWDMTIERNLSTCFNVTRNVITGMIARNYGRIINVSSVTGPLVSNPGEAAYSAAKAAMIGMSRSIALEVAKYNITVNNVAPGWVGTASQSEKEVIASRYTPFGRAGSATEMATMIAYLASPGASYVTGQMMVVDGGNCLQESKGP